MTTKRLQIKKRDAGHRSPGSDELTEIVTEEDKVRLNVEMSKSKRQSLKAKAAMEGCTVSDVINRLVDGYLKQ